MSLEKYQGAMIGLAVGDALGGLFEARDPDSIRAQCADVGALIAYPTEEIWYTDDTQMAIGVAETLRDLADILGANREAAIAREMTKRYEEVRTGGLGALADEIGAIDPLKGEVVVVVGPPEEENADETAIDALLTQLLETHSLKDAVQSAAAALGAPKKLVYGRALVIKGTNHGGDA